MDRVSPLTLKGASGKLPGVIQMPTESAAGLVSHRPGPDAARRNAPASPGNIGAMLLLAAIRGFSIPMTRFGLMTAPPLTMTAPRFAIAAPVLFLFIARQPRLPGRAFDKPLRVWGR